MSYSISVCVSIRSAFVLWSLLTREYRYHVGLIRAKTHVGWTLVDRTGEMRAKKAMSRDLRLVRDRSIAGMLGASSVSRRSSGGERANGE